MDSDKQQLQLAQICQALAQIAGSLDTLLPDFPAPEIAAAPPGDDAAATLDAVLHGMQALLERIESCRSENIAGGLQIDQELLRKRKLESVGAFAGGIAHDFNNILTGINTYLFMARMSVAGNEEACSLIAEAEKAALKAVSLTRQLLSFSRTGPSVRETVSIKRLIQDTVGFCLSGSHVDYQLSLPDGLDTVDVDRGQIDQALNAIILNAAQSMPEGGTVTISAENFAMDGQTAGTSSGVIPLKKGKYVKIMVQDEGVGIMDEHIERLFDPYFTTKKDGAGLGLATAYSIISRHGGHIQVHSAPDEGSLFTFYLPVSVGTDAQSRETSSAMMHHRGTGKVLVMDDEVILRTVVQSLLRKAGYSTVCVENGAQALAVYRQALTDGEPFIVTIMDLTIPGGMGAKETVKKLREIDPAAKVIVYSGYTNDPAIVQYSEYGFDGVLTKPFSMEEFMRTIVTVLGKPA